MFLPYRKFAANAMQTGLGLIAYLLPFYWEFQPLLNFSRVDSLDHAYHFSRVNISRSKKQVTASTVFTRPSRPTQKGRFGLDAISQVLCLRKRATTFKPQRLSVAWSRYLNSLFYPDIFIANLFIVCVHVAFLCQSPGCASRKPRCIYSVTKQIL